MAKELFSLASEIYKEPAYEVKKRKKLAIGILVASIVLIGLGIYDFSGFTFAATVNESIAIRENQVVLIKACSWFLGGLSALFMAAFLLHKAFWFFAFLLTCIADLILTVVSNSLGYKVFDDRTVSRSYTGLFILLCGVPAFIMILVAARNQKKHAKKS